MNLSLRRLTIFPKLVFAFMIVIVPLDVINLIMNQSGENIVRNELLQSSANNVHFYLSSLETEINRIMRVEKEYVSNDQDFQKAGVIPESLDDYERAQTILRLENKLSILKSSSPYIHNINIYFPKLGHTIQAGNLGDTIPTDELDAISYHAKHSESPFTYWNNKLFLGRVYPGGGATMSYALEVELSLPLLRQSLPTGTILTNEREGWFESNNKSDKITKDILEFVAQHSNGSELSDQKRMKLNNQQYLLYYERSSQLGITLIHYVPENQAMGVLGQYRTWYWIFLSVSFILAILFSYWIFFLIHQPMKRLVMGLGLVGEGNLVIRLHHKYQDEFQDVYHQFNAMTSRIQTLFDEILEVKTRSQRSELKQLQSQINPHFLYNSLFILLTLIKQEALPHAEQLVKHLGNYFRYITRNGEDEVALEKEILHAQAYVGIQSVRFPEFEVIWREFPVSCLNLMVPRLILQPIIENTFVHGLERKEEPGTLLIDADEVDGLLIINIEDNGERLDDKDIRALTARLDSVGQAAETTGLFNIHRRLQLKYGDEYGLKLLRGNLGGLHVMIHIPLSKEDKHV